MQPILLHTRHTQDIPVLQCLHIFKSYSQGQDVFNDAHLEVYRGDFVFLLGPAGAGKSTLIRLLLGLEPLNHGQILVEGVNVHHLPRKEIPLFRRRTGIVFQDLKLLMHRSVFENVALPLEAAAKENGLVVRKAHQVLRFFDLYSKRDIPCHRLSRGEQQLVTIARAAVNDPVIFLADEPTAYLDEFTSQIAFEFLRNMYVRGTTVIVATQAPALAYKASPTRIVTIEKGKILENTYHPGSISSGLEKGPMEAKRQ